MLGTFRVGEDITIALDAVRGDVADVLDITAQMGLAYRENGALKGAAFPVTVTARAADGDQLAGWLINVPAADSAALPTGIYALDARIELADAVEITTRTAYITLTKSTFG